MRFGGAAFGKNQMPAAKDVLCVDANLKIAFHVQ